MKQKHIKNYNNYLICEDGNVISLPLRQWNGKSWWTSKERTLKPTILKIGYKAVVLHKNKKGKTTYIHRLLAEHFIPNPLNKKQVNHKDGNKLNNSLLNLEWVTHKENIQHAFKNGFMKIVGSMGEKNGSAKLDTKLVKEIRNKKGKQTLKKTAIEFNISISNVWAIQNLKIWTHIK